MTGFRRRVLAKGSPLVRVQWRLDEQQLVLGAGSRHRWRTFEKVVSGRAHAAGERVSKE